MISRMHLKLQLRKSAQAILTLVPKGVNATGIEQTANNIDVDYDF